MTLQSGVRARGAWMIACFGLMAVGCGGTTTGDGREAVILPSPGLDSDAGTSGFDAAGIVAPEAQACLAASYVFAVDGQGGAAGIAGLNELDGKVGTWSASLTSSGTFLALNVSDTSTGTWTLAMASDATRGSPLAPGTYASSGDGHGLYLQIGANGGGCLGIVTGTFTLNALETSGADPTTVTKLFASFDVQCAGTKLTGCVSYMP